jgi:hypothetical protein
MTAAPDTPRTDPEPAARPEPPLHAPAPRIRIELLEGSTILIRRCCPFPDFGTGRVVNSGNTQHQRIICTSCETILADLSWVAS